MKLTLTLIAITICATAGAQIIVSDNFDSDPLGNINGVGNWFSLYTAFDVVAGGGARPSAYSGTQMLAVDDTNVTAGNYIEPEWNARDAGNNILVANIELFIQSDDTTGRSTNFAITSDTGDLLGDIGFSTSGDFFFGDSTLSGFQSGFGGSLNTWHDLQIVLDYTAKTSVLSVDGDYLATVAFASTENVNSIGLIVAGGSGTTEAYYDSLSARATPEPASLIGLGVAALPLIRRRRRLA